MDYDDNNNNNDDDDNDYIYRLPYSQLRPSFRPRDKPAHQTHQST